jgi:pilus assembly protein Flp/PilA
MQLISFTNFGDISSGRRSETTYTKKFWTIPRNRLKDNNSMLELFVSLQTFIATRKAEIEERGATAVEYALMVGLIAVAIITAVSVLGGKVKTTFNRVSNTLPS